MAYPNPRAAVRNASDPHQVRRAARKEQDRERLTLTAIESVMRTTDGRLVMWDLLSRCGVFGSIWHPSAEIHYRAGKQDMGHEIQALLLQASEDLYDLMAREARARAKREASETDAHHTARSEDQGASDGER